MTDSYENIFAKEVPICDGMANFLVRETGTKMSMNYLAQCIKAYIKNNSLYDSTNAKTILPDPKLTALLRLAPDDVLTVFNLARYLKIHLSYNYYFDIIK
jgi:chromatin remodeling complex protein RSC6